MNDTEQKLLSEYESISRQLQESTAYGTPEMVKLSKRQAELQGVVALITTKQRLLDDLETLNDPDMAELAETERPKLQAELERVEQDLKLDLLPKDPQDSKDVIVEIRAGAGGDEASLFAGELYRMYARYAERMGWKLELLSESPSEVGGFKEVVFGVHGSDVYAHLKYESGVHRVQRVPATESQGRIHTSTATVAVLPEAEETDIEINPSDLRIDVYHASGHGGQSVNTTDSAVRITHLPTGVVVTCQDEKSQLKNKLKAMSVLRSRLLAAKQEEEQRQNREARLSQIGTGDRSEKIRTYNFPQDRVTDHRIGLSRHNLPGFMDGDISEMMDGLRAEDMRLALEAAGR